jgi:thiol-disulfide isomerase/thioredoxin
MYKFYIFLIIGFFSCHASNKPDTLQHTIGSIGMAEIKLIDLQDHPINLESYKGKTVFINFWATWCKPCIEEMPSIEKTQTILNDKEVIFLLASSESIEEIKAFRNNHGYQFNYVHLENEETLNLQALPSTFIIDPKGKLVFSEMGSRNWNETANIDLIKNITKQHD